MRMIDEASLDESTIQQMYRLISGNMTRILPSTGTPEEQYAGWREAFDRCTNQGMRHLLHIQDGELRGYLSYTVDDTGASVNLCEFQIDPKRQRDGVTFRTLLGSFLDQIAESDAATVRTYANKVNAVSRSLAERLGFEVEEETHRGFRYRTDKSRLIGQLQLLLRSHRKRR